MALDDLLHPIYPVRVDGADVEAGSSSLVGFRYRIDMVSHRGTARCPRYRSAKAGS